VEEDGVKARVKKHDLKTISGGRVTLQNCPKVEAKGLER
jgi:hypothetical protein